MPPAVVAVGTFEELCGFVRVALCEQDALDPAQTPVFRTLVTRGGKPWGVLFHAEGPRLMKTTAVWAAADDRIVFYDSAGRRGREVALSEAPELPAAA